MQMAKQSWLKPFGKSCHSRLGNQGRNLVLEVDDTYSTPKHNRHKTITNSGEDEDDNYIYEGLDLESKSSDRLLLL